jgi:hypothetical protein
MLGLTILGAREDSKGQNQEEKIQGEKKEVENQKTSCIRIELDTKLVID